jgi:hypothetical protein
MRRPGAPLRFGEMGRRPDETREPEAGGRLVPSSIDDTAPELAVGSEVHDVEELTRQAALDGMLLAYLHDREESPHVAVELVLYVVSGSESCEKAKRTLARALERYERGEVNIVVRDLADGPKTVEDHKIVIVPTVMMRHPRVVFLPGDLPDNAPLLHDLLRSCGARLRQTSSSRR